MKCGKLQLGVVSVVALTALRVCVGWHFFSEGLKHTTEPGYTEGFLKQAKGPLATWFQRTLPDFHGWSRLMLAPEEDTRVASATSAKAEQAKAEKPKADAASGKEAAYSALA